MPEIFIPTIWSASVLRNFEKASVWASLLNRDYQGEAEYGNVVKIPRVDPVQVKKYTKGTPIVYDDITGSTVDLTIDRQSYFALKTEDIEVTQSKPAFLAAATRNAAASVADTIDIFCAETMADGITANCINTITTPLTLTSVNAIETIAKMAQKLTEQHCPMAGRWLVISPAVHTVLTFAMAGAVVPNQDILSDGFIGKSWGFNIFVSPNLPAVDDTTLMLAGTNAAGSLVMQIEKVETLRNAQQFGDCVRGLTVYGTKCVQPDALVGAYIES
jgi:N4-gp56 family major capsid protein